MKVVKKRLPEGVKKQFTTKIGKKVKIVNTLYCKKRKQKRKINKRRSDDLLLLWSCTCVSF